VGNAGGEELSPEELLSLPEVGCLPGEGGAIYVREVREEEVGVVSAEVGKELRIFVYPQELTDNLDGEHIGVAERGSWSACPETPEFSDTRSSMRQKTATMKVLRSTREEDLLSFDWFGRYTERREVFSLVQALNETCTRG
jgi:hypothetical protein